MVLELAVGANGRSPLPRGDYDLVVGLYPPTTLELLPFVGAGSARPGLVHLATVRVDDAIYLEP
jgi:hypothetical protein